MITIIIKKETTKVSIKHITILVRHLKIKADRIQIANGYIAELFIVAVNAMIYSSLT